MPCGVGAVIKHVGDGRIAAEGDRNDALSREALLCAERRRRESIYASGGGKQGSERVGQFHRSVHGSGHDDRCQYEHRPMEVPACQAYRWRCVSARRSSAL